MLSMLNIRWLLAVFFAICSLLLFEVNNRCFALEGGEVKEVKPIQQPVAVEPYVYMVEGRTDPFKPFISKKATTPVGRDPNEIVDEKTELTGMQLFEPAQLTLVGVLMTGSDEVALVEDQTKKGYMLRRGNLIGKRGVVSRIDKQQVVITEIAHTRSGKEISNTIVMRMKKEGDK